MLDQVKLKLTRFVWLTERQRNFWEIRFFNTIGPRVVILKVIKSIGERQVSQIDRDTGLSRESLYRSLDGELIPSFDTILKV